MSRKKRVLLTGVGGFIGSHCLRYFLEKTNWDIIALDSFRHKGTYSRLDEVLNSFGDSPTLDRVQVLRHDLTVPIDEQLENRIMSRSLNERGQLVEKKLDYIISMASDSAVERSVSDPLHCWRNNCELAVNMLELARRVKPKIFFQVSTDEVYGDCPPDYSHPEWDVIIPSNPYAASKAAQEALAISYWRTYDVPVVLTNCMNCIATMQDKEKFLPKLIGNIASGKEMEVYADFDENGEVTIGSRYYLHVENHADVFVFLANQSVAMYKNGDSRPDRYNVVGEVELNNLEMAQLIAKIMGKELKYKLVASESKRRGYDRRYALDGSKLREMGWKPPVDFYKGVEKIVQWTLDNPHWII
jgi:dTDP-glucose 4,6-dehydratase